MLRQTGRFSVGLLGITAGITATLALPSQAQTTATAGTSETSAKNVGAPTLLDNMILKFETLFNGPGLSDASLKKPDQFPTNSANLSDPWDADSIIAVGYKVTPELSISGNLSFLYTPVANDVGTLAGQDITLKDPYLRVNHSSLLKAGNFNLAGDVRFYVPVGDSTQHNKEQFLSIRSTQNATFEVPNSKLTVGLVLYERAYMMSDDALVDSDGKSLDSRNQLKLYAGPNLAYQLSPTLSATLLYEAVAVSKFGSSLTDLQAAGTDLEPGISWDITPKINFSPYLDIKTGGKISLETTSVGFFLGASFI